MGNRLDLQNLLRSVLGSDNVYFQPPPSVELKYPCIVYSLTDQTVRHSSNLPYTVINRYKVILVDRDPDSVVIDELSKLKRCRLNSVYTADGLNHFWYTLYF